MKTAIITGAGGGMGSAAAEKLAGEGYSVYGIDLREPEEPGSFRFIQADLTDAASVENARSIIESEAGGIDLIVHLAGMYDLNSLIEMGEEEFLRIFDVNLFAVYRVNKALLPLMNEGGRIIITASELAPLDPLPFTGIYAITKAALDKYAYSLRMELQLLGIKVIVLRPGAVDTGLLDVSTKRLDDFCRNTELYNVGAEKFRSIVDKVEARKILPERIADLIVKAAAKKRPRLVYSVNRNPLLLLLNALPDRLQCAIIGRILRDRSGKA